MSELGTKMLLNNLSDVIDIQRKEIARLTAEVERMRSVVDAVRKAEVVNRDPTTGVYTVTLSSETWALLHTFNDPLFRALDGEHADNVTPPADLLRGSDADGEPWDGGGWLDRAHELGKDIPQDGSRNHSASVDDWDK